MLSSRPLIRRWQQFGQWDAFFLGDLCQPPFVALLSFSPALSQTLSQTLRQSLSQTLSTGFGAHPGAPFAPFVQCPKHKPHSSFDQNRDHGVYHRAHIHLSRQYFPTGASMPLPPLKPVGQQQGRREDPERGDHGVTTQPPPFPPLIRHIFHQCSILKRSSRRDGAVVLMPMVARAARPPSTAWCHQFPDGFTASGGWYNRATFPTFQPTCNEVFEYEY